MQGVEGMGGGGGAVVVRSLARRGVELGMMRIRQSNVYTRVRVISSHAVLMVQ